MACIFCFWRMLPRLVSTSKSRSVRVFQLFGPSYCRGSIRCLVLGDSQARPWRMFSSLRSGTASTTKSKCYMAIVAPPTHVRKMFQRSDRRDCVAGVASAAHVWGLAQPGDRRSRVAGVASAAHVRILFQPDDRQGRVASVASAAHVRILFQPGD